MGVDFDLDSNLQHLLISIAPNDGNEEHLVAYRSSMTRKEQIEAADRLQLVPRHHADDAKKSLTH